MFSTRPPGTQPQCYGDRIFARTRGIGTILTLWGRTFYESRPIHQLSSCLLLLVTAHVKVCHLVYDIASLMGSIGLCVFCVKIFCNITTKSGSLRNSMQKCGGKYCGGEKILSPQWFQHCGGERPRRSDASGPDTFWAYQKTLFI